MDGTFGFGEADPEQVIFPVCAVNTAVAVDTTQATVAEMLSCAPTSSPVPQGTRAIPQDGSGCTLDGDYEDFTFVIDDVEKILGCMVPTVVNWLNGALTFEAVTGAPNNYVFVPADFEGSGFGFRDGEPEGCPITGNSMQYCPGDGNVYVGQARAWWYFNDIGDAALLNVLAHETGHRIQHAVGQPGAETDNEQIYRENQADCVGGVFMNYLSYNGILYQNDVFDFANGVIAIGSPIEGPQRTHGTSDQRMRAFYWGYNSGNGGLFQCNSYVANYPLVAAPQGATEVAPSETVGAQVGDPQPTAAPTTTIAGGTTTTLPAAPAATLELPATGGNETNDALGQQCYVGLMAACDDLYEAVRTDTALAEWTVFADTCGGRQPEGTGKLCVDVFSSTMEVAAPPTAATTTTTTPPTTTGPALTTTAPAATTTGPAATTTAPGPTTVAPVERSIATLDQAMAVCVPQTITEFNARVAETSNPDAFPALATERGVTLDELLRSEMTEKHFDAGTPEASILLLDPFQNTGPEEDAPLTSWGLLYGEMLNCLINSTDISQTAFDAYMAADEGETTWSISETSADGTAFTASWKLTWFVQPLEEGGENHFFVRLTDEDDAGE